MGVSQRVPAHQHQAYQQIPQSKSCNCKGPYETPTPCYTKHYAQGKNSAGATRASHHFPSNPRTEYSQQRVKCICWSPNWNEPRIAMGTPQIGILKNPYPNRFGDPRTNMGIAFLVSISVTHKIGHRFRDPRIGSGITESKFARIPEPIRESPNRFGYPQTKTGIPESHHTKTGIPESVWGLFSH